MNIKEYFTNKNLNIVLPRKLTTREVDVLKKYASGFSIKEISSILKISESTVRTHINNIFQKIEIDNSADSKITLCHFWTIWEQELNEEKNK